MDLRTLIFLFLTVAFGGSALSQDDPSGFLMIEEINDDYSVGYKSADEEFGGYGDMWIISKNDTLPISEVEANICTFSSVSPNGIFATFETISMGWVYPSETDSILHDRWSGVIVELSSAKVVKYYRDDYGDDWNSHNLWLQGTDIVFNGNDTLQHSGETVYHRSKESSDVSWITYFESGEVKETGQSSDVFGCGMNVGTHNFYNESRERIKSIRYENWMPEDAQGCHEVIQDIYVCEYSEPYSRLKFRKMFQCDYEGEEVKTGIWQEFDGNRHIITSVDYGMVYDRLKLQSKRVDIWRPEISEIRITNYADTLILTNGDNGWESDSITEINPEILAPLLERLESHRLQPIDVDYFLGYFGEIRFIASGKEQVYRLAKLNNHIYDAIYYDGSYFKVTKEGLLGMPFTPFVSVLDKWNWERRNLSSGLNGISEVQFQSGVYESHTSFSSEYTEGFLNLEWHKHIEKPSNDVIGKSIGELSVKHKSGTKSYRFFQKFESEFEESNDEDYFYIEIEGDWFIGSYYSFNRFFIYQK